MCRKGLFKALCPMQLHTVIHLNPKATTALTCPVHIYMSQAVLPYILYILTAHIQIPSAHALTHPMHTDLPLSPLSHICFS